MIWIQAVPGAKTETGPFTYIRVTWQLVFLFNNKMASFVCTDLVDKCQAEIQVANLLKSHRADSGWDHQSYRRLPRQGEGESFICALRLTRQAQCASQYSVPSRQGTPLNLEGTGDLSIVYGGGDSWVSTLVWLVISNTKSGGPGVLLTLLFGSES